MFFKYNYLTLLWATVILFLTLLPAASMPKVPEWQLVSFTTASHAFVFLVLAVLMCRGFTKQASFSYLRRHSGWITFLTSVLFGVMIEYLQTSLGWGRQGDMMDVVSNTIGTIAGIAAFFVAHRYQLLHNLL